MDNFKLPNTKEEKTVLKTVRIKQATIKKIEVLSKDSNLSINRIITECIEFALNNLEEAVFLKKK